MQKTHYEELLADRHAWLTLVRAACLSQAEGRLTAVTVSRRFDPTVFEAQLDQFVRASVYLASEYGLAAEVQQEGNSLSVRISKPQVSAGSVADLRLPEREPARHSMLHSLLRFVWRQGASREAHS